MLIVGEVKAKNAFADLTLGYGRARCHALPSSIKDKKAWLSAMLLYEEIWEKSLLTSSSCHPKIFVKEFSYFLMPCHQHCLGVNLLVQR